MPSLLLHAGDPHWAPENTGKLVGELGDIGFVGDALSGLSDDSFRAGESFLSLIMFLGCSPQVELDPDTAPPGASFCYLQIHQYPEISFVSADKRSPPRCSSCRAPVDSLPELSCRAVYTCPTCAASYAMHELDWRRAAGFGRCFIEIHGIYPQEAVPADKLLATLESISGCRWDYFYT